MPTIKVEFTADVKAKAERLWSILTDIQSWNQWLDTSYTKSITQGLLNEGSIFSAELGGIKWNIAVIKAKRPEKLCWAGQRFGIKAVHDWEFYEGEEKTKIVTRESMSGWILFLIYPVIKSRLSKYDEKWLADLKTRAEIN
jgi:hypothetical protein